MTPLVCACYTAWTNLRNRPIRSFRLRLCASQYRVMLSPSASSMTKQGRCSRSPASMIFAAQPTSARASGQDARASCGLGPARFLVGVEQTPETRAELAVDVLPFPARPFRLASRMIRELKE